MRISMHRGWTPDFISFAVPEGGLLKAKNVIPYDTHYGSIGDKTAYSSNAVSGTALKAQEFKDNSGNTYVLVGTTNKLYLMDSTKAFTDVSRTATYNTAESWSFAQYGDWIVATNYVDPPQVMKGISTSTVFQDLGGSPPQSKYLLFHKGHLIHAYVNESGTVSPKKLVWSAFEDIENYTPSLTTGADYQDLADAHGEIVGIENVGDNFAVFHRHSITLGWYGGTYVFNFAPNRVKNITIIPNSMVSIGHAVLFWEERNIYMFDGNSIVPVGDPVKRTVLGNLNRGFYNRITAVHDPQNNIVYWAYPSTASTDGTPDRILCFNYSTKRFTLIEVSTDALCLISTGGYDMDSLDAVYPSLDDIPISLDSSYWLAQQQILACMDNDSGKMATFSGQPMQAELETPEISVEDKVLFVRRVRPLLDRAVGNVIVAVGARMTESDSYRYVASATAASSGYVNLRATGRYLRFNVKATSHAGIVGLEVDIKEAGRR